jgi:hypothetical protein
MSQNSFILQLSSKFKMNIGMKQQGINPKVNLYLQQNSLIWQSEEISHLNFCGKPLNT